MFDLTFKMKGVTREYYNVSYYWMLAIIFYSEKDFTFMSEYTSFSLSFLFFFLVLSSLVLFNLLSIRIKLASKGSDVR